MRNLRHSRPDWLAIERPQADNRGSVLDGSRSCLMEYNVPGFFRRGEHETVAKKKAAKEIKRLKKRTKEATAENLTLERQLRKLKKKLDARKQQIAELQGRLHPASPTTEPTQRIEEGFDDIDGKSIALSHRSAWKQHSYLRDRYEFHLGAGATNERARHQANEDLKKAFGTDRGYSKEELLAILS